MGLDQAEAASEPGLAQPVMTLDQMGNNGKLTSSYCCSCTGVNGGAELDMNLVATAQLLLLQKALQNLLRIQRARFKKSEKASSFLILTFE